MDVDQAGGDDEVYVIPQNDPPVTTLEPPMYQSLFPQKTVVLTTGLNEGKNEAPPPYVSEYKE